MLTENIQIDGKVDDEYAGKGEPVEDRERGAGREGGGEREREREREVKRALVTESSTEIMDYYTTSTFNGSKFL